MIGKGLSKSETRRGRKLRPLRTAMLLVLGAVAAHNLLSSALSASAETQAAIDAVTLARAHLE